MEINQLQGEKEPHGSFFVLRGLFEKAGEAFEYGVLTHIKLSEPVLKRDTNFFAELVEAVHSKHPVNRAQGKLQVSLSSHR